MASSTSGAARGAGGAGAARPARPPAKKKAQAAKPEAAKPEVAKPDAAKPEAGKAPANEGLTSRVVLRRERVLMVPEGFDAGADEKKMPKELLKLVGAPVIEAWVAVGEFPGGSKQASIEAYAGKPNTPGAKVGAFKAVPASAFRGGRNYERPPEPKVEVRDLD